MSERRTGTRGFGYQPARSAGYHFEVRHAPSGGISVWERFGGAAEGEKARERARLSPHRWSPVQGAVAADFNQRLQQARITPGRWMKQVTPLAPHFGKELVLLIWAIEDQDLTLIPRMLANWRGLAPEERWWFYTTINASPRSRAADQSYGWKAAVKIAFLDEPQDIGLESLRIGSGPTTVDEYEVSPKRKKRKSQKNPDGETDSVLQGRLFAEPDAPNG